MIACSHCHLEFNEDSLIKETIDEKQHYFCCNGCKSVFHFLHSMNLDSFYNKLGSNTLAPVGEDVRDFKIFDNPSFIEEFREEDGEHYKISLSLEGIHCVACIWLIEKVLERLDGVHLVNIHYTNSKATIKYDKSLELSQIISSIDRIGYKSFPYNPKISEDSNLREKRASFLRMIVGVFCTMNIMWVAVSQYSGYFLGMEEGIKDILNIAAFILSSVALFYSGYYFLRSGYFGLRQGFLNMDALVSIGALLTYSYSIYAAFKGFETYFESLTMIITFLSIGKYLELRVRHHAGNAVTKLVSSLPPLLELEDGRMLNPFEVNIGDTLLIRAGETIALDSILQSPEAAFNESFISGESNTVYKNYGDEVISGSVNLIHSIKCRVSRLYKDSRVNKIASLMNEAIEIKPRIEKLTQLISFKFSFVTLALTILTFIFHYYFHGFDLAFTNALAVIIIACPCALALATPIACIVGINVALKNRILFKDPNLLEDLAKIDYIVLDKTGSITLGKPNVHISNIISPYDETILGSFTRLSKHPISCAINNHIKSKTESNSKQIEDIEILNFSEEIGGIKGTYNDQVLLGGSLNFLKEMGVNVSNVEAKSTLFAFSINAELKAIFYINDELREGVNETISYFKSKGIKISILSGDNKEAVTNIATELNIDEYYYEVSPEFKYEYLKGIIKEHKPLMVGDGINDALALSISPLSCSFEMASDIAKLSANIILLDNNFTHLSKAHKISSITYRTIKQNLFFSIIYNLITIPIAACGYILPIYAALSMSFSSLIVMFNSIAIQNRYDDTTKTK